MENLQKIFAVVNLAITVDWIEQSNRITKKSCLIEKYSIVNLSFMFHDLSSSNNSVLLAVKYLNSFMGCFFKANAEGCRRFIYIDADPLKTRFFLMNLWDELTQCLSFSLPGPPCAGS